CRYTRIRIQYAEPVRVEQQFAARSPLQQSTFINVRHAANRSCYAVPLLRCEKSAAQPFACFLDVSAPHPATNVALPYEQQASFRERLPGKIDSPSAIHRRTASLPLLQQHIAQHALDP